MLLSVIPLSSLPIKLLSCNSFKWEPSKGDSSWFSLTDYIEWESIEGDSSGSFSIYWTHSYFDLCYRRVDPEGYPQGNVKSGLPGGHPRVIMWRNDRAGGDHPVRDPCVTKSERQVVCSSLRAPNNAITDLGIDLSGSSCPIRTTTTWDNGYGPLCVVRFFRKLCQTSSSALWHGRIVPMALVFTLLTTTRRAQGDGPRPLSS